MQVLLAVILATVVALSARQHSSYAKQSASTTITHSHTLVSITRVATYWKGAHYQHSYTSLKHSCKKRL